MGARLRRQRRNDHKYSTHFAISSTCACRTLNNPFSVISSTCACRTLNNPFSVISSTCACRTLNNPFSVIIRCCLRALNMKRLVSFILSSVCFICNLFSSVSFSRYLGLCLFQLTNFACLELEMNTKQFSVEEDMHNFTCNTPFQIEQIVTMCLSKIPYNLFRTCCYSLPWYVRFCFSRAPNILIAICLHVMRVHI